MRTGPRGPEAGLAVCAIIVAVAIVTGLAGQLAALTSGHGWPRWHGIGWELLRPLAGVYLHAADPMRNWPGLPPTITVPAVMYWICFAVVIGAAMTLAVVTVRVVVGRRSRPGFARRRDVAARLGTTALVKQAPRLRPALARTTSRPRAEQLGTRLGRDVHTGIDCWSSVRQSKYVVGPSESGKTSAVVIPEALDHDGPLLAPSSRADVMAATWRSRSERGRVLLFDPLRTAPGLPLLRWDLVWACTDPAVAMRRAQDLMASVDMTGVSNGDAWKNRGQAVLRNLLHAAALDHRDIRTVLRWAYDQTSVEPAAILDRGGVTPGNWAEMQYSVIQTPERQRAGYYMAVEGALEPFMHPAVLETCLPGAGQQFDPVSFLDPTGGQQTIYMIAQVDQAVAVTDLLGALMDEIIELARAAAQRSENNRLDPPLKFLVDEAPNTATLKQLPSLISDGGGRGIPTTMVVQDRHQAARRWGRDDAASMWGAATIRQVLPGVAGEDEMREIAAYFGEFDEEVPSVTRGAQGHSEQISVRTRAAMTPADVRSIASFHSLVIAAGGLRPIETELVPYFRRPDAGLTARAERDFYTALNEGRTVL
ncbi:MAG TPA: type IV secretory system conjugative DNA transfer family protein [Pseudonocardiaceae bacterium]|nr:type IV secretory system conjugative DNA transfer family protein [Pseudonocardiaceae bacterium]